MQEETAGDSKLPTLVRYTQGRPIAFGADAEEDPDIDGEPSHLARWFKLHLHPQSMRSNSNLEVPPLPPNVPLTVRLLAFFVFAFHDHEALT